jgi:signal transduction histidine kinase
MTDSPDDQTDNLVELERARIGHEIHDALLPLIFAASGGVQAAINQLPADANLSKQKLDQASQWLTEAMLIGRQLLTEIYPPELTGTLWVRAAKDTISRLFVDRGTAVQWKTDDAVEETSTDIAVTAYRIVVEAVRNALRHGQAAHVLVEATRNVDTIQVMIHDDGRGFTPTDVPNDRFGIRSMSGRANLVGGSLRVESKVGGPTIVTLKMPTPN